MKKIISLLAVFILLLSFVPTAEATGAGVIGDIKVYIDNELIEKRGVITNDRTYLPVRALCEKIGVKVEWVEKTKSVILGTPPAFTEKGNDVNIYLNASKLETAKAIIIDGSTYLPVRALCEAMNMGVTWNGATREVFVFSQASSVTRFLNDECFLALDENTKERYTIVFTSTNVIGNSFKKQLEANLYKNDYFNLSSEEKAPIIGDIISDAPYYRTQVGKISSTDSASYTITSVTHNPSYDVWRGEKKPVWVYSVTMDGDKPETPHIFEYVSTVESQENAETAIRALSRFPYGVRKLVERITNAPSTANTFNGGGNYIWIRLNYEPSEEAIAQSYSCVLGFILSANSTEYSFWGNAIKDDVIPLSKFGQTNIVSDFGEFCTLYFNLKDIDDGLEEIKKIYPNRFRVFAAVLYSTDNEYFSEYKTYYDTLYALEEERENNRQYFTLSLPGTNLYLTHVDDNNDFAYFKEYTGEANQLWYEDSISTNTVIKSKSSNLMLSPMRDIDDIMIGGIYMADQRQLFSSEADGNRQAVTIKRDGNRCTIYFNKMGAYLGQYSSDETRAYPVESKTEFIITPVN